MRHLNTLLVSVAAFVLPSALPSFASPPPSAELPDLVEKILPGVVNISSTTIVNYQVHGMEDFLQLWGIPQERKQTSLGSGFIIDKDGFIITNNHVVDQATEVIVTMLDKRQYKARIVGKDQKMDVALLQIRDEEHHVPASLAPTPLGNSDQVRIAESVFTVGNPFGLQHTVTAGIISAKNRTIGQGPFDNFLQTDASINPGNSGGPLFNMKGEVIGINTVIFSRVGQSGGLGFAIPINAAKELLADLKRYGRVPRPWLGVLGQPMSKQLQVYYRLGTENGVLVTNLVESGPADQAGLVRGDIITAVDGTDVKEPNDLERALSKRKATDQTHLKVMRGRKTLELKVKLEELPKLEKLPQGIL